MAHYRVYRRRHDGILSYLASSESLGSSSYDVGHIVDSHDLVEGDVIEIDDSFLLIKEIFPPVEWRDPSDVRFEYLPRYESVEHVFGDGSWSPMMMARLRHEARTCEEMSR